MKTDSSHIDQAKRVIIGLLQEAGGQLDGKTKLYKAFYLAHLFYWSKAKGTLTDYPVVHMPYGHGIDRGDDLLAVLQDEGWIESVSQLSGPYPETSYRLREGKRIELGAEEREAMRRAVEMVKKMTATQLSQLIHEHSRSWRDAKEGDILDIYLDLLSDEDFNRNAESLAKARRLLARLGS